MKPILLNQNSTKLKYSSLNNDLNPQYCNRKLERHSIEVSDISKFCKSALSECLPLTLKNHIIKSVIASSYAIYCNRNKVDQYYMFIGEAIGVLYYQPSGRYERPTQRRFTLIFMICVHSRHACEHYLSLHNFTCLLHDVYINVN